MVRNFSLSDQHEHGNVLIELAIVIVTLIMLLAGFVDLTRVFGVSQSVSQLSRELANLAFRECSHLPETDPDSDRTLGNCLQAQVAAVTLATRQAGGNYANALQFRIAVYSWDGTNPRLLEQRSRGLAGRIDSSAPRFRSMLQQSGVLTVAEVRMPVRSHFGNLIPNFPQEVYETSIF